MPGSSNDINPAAAKSELSYEAAPVRRSEHREGAFTRVIEQQTAKVPSDVFLFAALGATGLSAVLEFAGKKDLSRFVGQWAPTLLICGVYNKLVKILGPR